MSRRLAGLVCLIFFAACGGDDEGAAPAPTATSMPPTATATATATPAPTVRAPGPWQRTEERADCAGFDALRQPYFGDLHVHTSFSADAYIFGTRVDPRGAYEFAQGGTIPLSDAFEQQTRSATITRVLDFAAVTDHSEFLGEVNLCTVPDSPVYDVELCQLLRQSEDPSDRFPVTVAWLFPAGVPDPPASHEFCFEGVVDCDAAASSAWKEIQEAAEEAYDRSDACSFTTFVGYEHTASLLGRHKHRNVIFRNDHVPTFPSSQLETAGNGFPQGLWSAIETDCLGAGSGCEAVIIPHNSNLSGGEQFVDPLDAADARRRQRLEPLVEIYQQKGGSECRFDRLAGTGVGTEDELCTFEQLLVPHEFPGTKPPPIDEYPRRNLVRNALKDGLAFEETLGANPFQFGFIGSTDNHDAAAGNTSEAGWEGGGGNSDATPERRIARSYRDNPGGLAVVWAEENSRDALFAALKRRETYATSGTRPIVRFFAGSLDGVRCGADDFIERAYQTGTPMGGEIGYVAGGPMPRFAVLAIKDPGTAEDLGTDLQRIQLVKGWVDQSGETHERVYDVAGDANNGAGVDPDTCATVGAGADTLCAVWQDDDFDPSQRAFYYARVLENPTCRWSTLVCKEQGVDPFSDDCAAQAEAVGGDFTNCCIREADDPFASPLIQERAWTSPIWYRPESIASVEGTLTFGAEEGGDSFELAIRIGRLPPELDTEPFDLRVALTDDDEIYRAVIPASAIASPGSPSGIEGLDAVSFTVEEDGSATLSLEASGLDLASADRVDHAVTVSVTTSAFEGHHTRFWRSVGDQLVLD